ncbi:MAG: lysoplasmalogenase [Parvularculaceae bacterium]|nr:lysoplasmalogenase [Parvularculaceae bacterium]
MTPHFFVALCGAFTLGLLYAEHKESAALKQVFKPAASLAFILAGIAAGGLETPFGRLILTGLVLCALGDVLLIPRAPRFFLAGMGAFAAGHGAYIAAFAVGGVAMSPAVLLATAAAGVFSAGLVIWLWRDLGRFQAPVIAYAAVISAMVASAAAHFAAAPSREAAQLFLAAAGFAVSDFSVARDQFRKRSFFNRLWGLPLYYAAQCLFGLSV